MSVGRAIVALVWLLADPLSAHAVPVTWEAKGKVESSSLDSAFFATYMPELAGTVLGETLLLRITFDTDAAFVRRMDFPAGGTAFLFDALSLALAIEVPGRGTHVFTIDHPTPGFPVRPHVVIVDDRVIGDPGELILDGLQFGHEYLTDGGLLLFDVQASFSSTDTSIFSGANLPLSPDPRLSTGMERQITIGDQSGRSLFGIFTSLVRLPITVPEPGSLALLCVGLAALRVARRGRTGDKTKQCP